MNKLLTGVALVLLCPAVLAAPHNNHNNTNHNTNHNTNQSSSSAGAASGSSSNSESGAAANNQTLSQTDAPAVYYGDNHIVVGGGKDSPTLFIVKPDVVDLAAGVQMRDGQTFVDGHSSTCDQDQRGGLPKCW